jgi:hypothetical protein
MIPDKLTDRKIVREEQGHNHERLYHEASEWAIACAVTLGIGLLEIRATGVKDPT